MVHYSLDFLLLLYMVKQKSKGQSELKDSHIVKGFCFSSNWLNRIEKVYKSDIKVDDK